MFDESSNLYEAIESGLKIVPRRKNLEIAMYNGLLKTNIYMGYQHDFEFYYPHSFVDDFPFFGNTIVRKYAQTFDDWVASEFKRVCNQTMRLNGEDGVFFRYHNSGNNTNIVDVDEVYKFDINARKLNLNVFYNYDGRNYMPII